MSLKALTANTAPEENAHILAEDDAAIFQSMFGDDGVLEIGQQMKATVISNNKVRVADGVVCIGGHVARTVYGDYTDLTIENGESGKNRNDLIIGTFSTTGAGGIDTMQLAVKKGTAGTAATDPALTQGNLYAGSKLREVPLWRVKIEGLSITKVEQLFEIVPSIPTLKKELESLNGNIISVEHKDIGIHAVDAGSYTDIPVDLKQFGMSKIISVIPIMQSRSSSARYGLLTLGLYEFNQNTATFRVFNADGSKREPRINACVIGFKQLINTEHPRSYQRCSTNWYIR